MESYFSELVCDTPQDRVLIMMIERISSLEDEVNKQNAKLEQLLTHLGYNTFSLDITTINNNSGLRNITPTLVEAVIKQCSISSIHALYHPNDKYCHMFICTNNKYLPEAFQDIIKKAIAEIVVLNDIRPHRHTPPLHYEYIRI